MSVNLLSRSVLKENEYALKIAPLADDFGLAISLSDRSIRFISYNSSKVSPTFVINDAHVESITDIKSLSSSNIVSCGADGVKIWDVRTGGHSPQAHLTSTLPNHGILSLDISFDFNRIAAGTELFASDAGVHVWDIRNLKYPLVSYVDSHNDDVTAVRFHPQKLNCLISGSTDGLINIYDTNINDEDDAVYQTINHEASIHSTGFISEKKIYALSHMETFSIYDVADPDSSVVEPPPCRFGDIRKLWKCEYVIDVIPGYIACGSSSISNFKLIPFINENAKVHDAITFQGGHKEEVVRSIYYSEKLHTLYSCGEDGAVTLWDTKDLVNSNMSYTSWTSWNNPSNSKTENYTKSKVKIPETYRKENKSKKDSKKTKRYNPY